MGVQYEASNDDNHSVHNGEEGDDDDAEQSTNSDPDSKLSSRQKIQRNRTAFTQEQIAALEKGFFFFEILFICFHNLFSFHRI